MQSMIEARASTDRNITTWWNARYRSTGSDSDVQASRKEDTENRNCDQEKDEVGLNIR